jgi:hypothetical protein
MIIQEVDYLTLPTCLRVSKHCFEVAGKNLYAELLIDEETDVQKLMMGAEITNPRIKRGSGAEITDQPKTNFKRKLLKFVQSVTIRTHRCPDQRAARTALIKAAGTMTSLKRMILSPHADFMATHPLCDEERGCPITAGLKCHSLTIHNIQIDGTDDGPLKLFLKELDHVQHATLVIPPTAFYMGSLPGQMAHLSGRPEDLAYPTRKLKSVRLIVAISEMDLLMQGDDSAVPAKLAPNTAVQEFLASFINLNPTEIEIYLFNNFDNTLNLVTFREQLKAKLDKHLKDSIKYLKESDKLKPEHENWSANYKVLGLEHYFVHPTRYYELDDMWMDDWSWELHARQTARIAALKAAAAADDEEEEEGEEGEEEEEQEEQEEQEKEGNEEEEGEEKEKAQEFDQSKRDQEEVSET